MGVLKVSEGDLHVVLSARCLVGRHPRCDLRLSNRRASGEHAAIYWSEGRWEVRDLGSSNGTFVNGKRLGPRERLIIGQGDVIGIGGDITLVLEHSGPPQAVARNEASGELRPADEGMIVLPDAQQPIASIFEDGSGHWVVERGDTTTPLNDGDVIEAGDTRWVIQLPAPIESTLQSSGGAGLTLDMVSLRFRVSRDEEHVDAFLLYRRLEKRLETRAYHYMLVTLARLRLKDRDAEVEEAERGWVHREELCRMLAVDNNKLNVDIFRARKQLATMGVLGAAGLIERRASGHVRMGVARTEVQQAHDES